jgi:quercetin dioxygenase-like cupin family protein
MTNNSITQPITRRFLAAAVAATAGVALASVALAAECPVDKRGVNVTKPGATASTGVADTVLTSIDLSKEKLALADHQLRLRRLVVEPNGIVAWHSHEDRPAIIYIISGEIYEYASNCSVPILHRAGDVTPERSGTAHWWQNTGKETVVLLSADVLHDANDHNM